MTRNHVEDPSHFLADDDPIHEEMRAFSASPPEEVAEEDRRLVAEIEKADDPVKFEADFLAAMNRGLGFEVALEYARNGGTLPPAVYNHDNFFKDVVAEYPGPGTRRGDGETGEPGR